MKKDNPLDGFKVRGTALLNFRPPILDKAMAHLDKLPFKTVVTRQELQAALGLSAASSCLAESTSRPELRPYRCKYGRGFLYGSKKTIAELKRRLGQE